MVRRLVLVAALVVAAPAAAATIHGKAPGQLIVGTETSDRIVAGTAPAYVQVAWGGVDHVTCGRGADVVSADRSDVVSGCAFVSRRLSVDPSSNPKSQHETAVEPDDAANGSTVVAAYQVGRLQTGASSNIGFAVSADAGLHWQHGLLPSLTVESTPAGTQTAASDPTVAYDATHGVWLIGTLTLEPSSSHVMVARSPNGLGWSSPVTVATGPLLDKDWFVCDNGATSPHRGRCYATYTDDAKNTTIVQSSDDGGATWSVPVTMGRILVGTQPVVLADGTLVVIAGDYQGEAALTGAMAGFRSKDGGATWSPFTITSFQAAKPGVMRAISLPSVEVDAAGTIYVAWDDCRFRPACDANDIVLSTSHDEGVTWSTPTRVTTGPEAIIPGLAADPVNAGGLALVYGTLDAAGRLGIALTQSRDGGTTWTKAQRLDAQPIDTSWLAEAEGGRMVGDYFSAEFAGGRVVPVFALATSKLGSRFREGIFSTSVKALG